MGSEGHPLHIFFFPFMASGHLLPMMDAAKLFASRGVRATLLLTPSSASAFEKTVLRWSSVGYRVHLLRIEFPPEAGLSADEENPDKMMDKDSKPKFLRAIGTLERPFEEAVSAHRPDCIVSDIFFPWTADVAARTGVPRIVFHGSSFFAVCVFDALRRYSPHAAATADDEAFVVPGLPDRVELTRAQLPPPLLTRTESSRLWGEIRAADEKTCGVLMNSFYELERDYVDHLKAEMGKKAWGIGPVSLCNREPEEMAERGGTAGVVRRHECLKWLDSRKPSSVLYICFGSLCKLGPDQLKEIAGALESSGCSFVWVVKTGESLPEGFEERTGERGQVIRGWAPQIPIVNHPAVGGFVTHCGWNSVLEGVTAGLPMITWPTFAEQFFNEKLIVDVLRIGVGVGAACYGSLHDTTTRPVIGKEVIEEAVRRVMGDSQEARGMRKRARELADIGKKAPEEGGSSYADLDRLIDELMSIRNGTRSCRV